MYRIATQLLSAPLPSVLCRPSGHKRRRRHVPAVAGCGPFEDQRSAGGPLRPLGPAAPMPVRGPSITSPRSSARACSAPGWSPIQAPPPSTTSSSCSWHSSSNSSRCSNRSCSCSPRSVMRHRRRHRSLPPHAGPSHHRRHGDHQHRSNNASSSPCNGSQRNERRHLPLAEQRSSPAFPAETLPPGDAPVARRAASLTLQHEARGRFPSSSRPRGSGPAVTSRPDRLPAPNDAGSFEPHSRSRSNHQSSGSRSHGRRVPNQRTCSVALLLSPHSQQRQPRRISALTTPLLAPRSASTLLFT